MPAVWEEGTFTRRVVTFWLKSSLRLSGRLEPCIFMYRCIIFISWSLWIWSKLSNSHWVCKMNIAKNARHDDKMCKVLFWNGHDRDLFSCALHEHFKTTACFGMKVFVCLFFQWKIKTTQNKTKNLAALLPWNGYQFWIPRNILCNRKTVTWSAVEVQMFEIKWFRQRNCTAKDQVHFYYFFFQNFRQYAANIYVCEAEV